MVNDQETENQINIIKKQKQKQAILYAIKNDKEINRTKLMKYVFFVDLFAYNKFKYTILEDEYLRLQNGPVPKFGFYYTAPNSPEKHEKDFTMDRVYENERYYYYKFNLAKGVKPNLTQNFSQIEQDLLNLTLKMIKTHCAADLSEYTHRLSLWKNHATSDIIETQDFKLREDEMDDLESLLHTKIYVDAVNPKQGFWDEHINSPGKKPKRLPELVDVKTGNVL